MITILWAARMWCMAFAAMVVIWPVFLPIQATMRFDRSLSECCW